MTEQQQEKTYPIRGRVLIARVVSAKMNKTAVCELDRLQFNSKYHRHERKQTRVKAHNAESINAKEGDIVKIGETRPISKTKSFVIIEKVKEA